MSVSLLIRDKRGAEQRLVPVATQQNFVASWLPGITELGAEWIELMETGFDVTPANREAVVGELTKLRAWMVGNLGVSTLEIERLDGLVTELLGLRFDVEATAFLG